MNDQQPDGAWLYVCVEEPCNVAWWSGKKFCPDCDQEGLLVWDGDWSELIVRLSKN